MKGFDDMESAKKIKAALQPFVFDYIKEKGGSISAEHGVGPVSYTHRTLPTNREV